MKQPLSPENKIGGGDGLANTVNVTLDTFLQMAHLAS